MEFAQQQQQQQQATSNQVQQQQQQQQQNHVEISTPQSSTSPNHPLSQSTGNYGNSASDQTQTGKTIEKVENDQKNLEVTNSSGTVIEKTGADTSKSVLDLIENHE